MRRGHTMKPRSWRPTQRRMSLEEEFAWSVKNKGADWKLTLEEYRALWAPYDWDDPTWVMEKRDPLKPYTIENMHIRVWRGTRTEAAARRKEVLARLSAEVALEKRIARAKKAREARNSWASLKPK